MFRKLVIVSNEEGKITEFNEIFSEIGWRAVPFSKFSESPILFEGNDFADNALRQAAWAVRKSNLPTLGDVSGLKVHNLGGFPGVKSTPFAEEMGNYPKAMGKLFEMLEGKEATASFECDLVLSLPNMGEKLFVGEVSGRIIPHKEGDEGWGYDAYFIPDGYDKTFASMGEVQKNKISHRAKALLQLFNYLKNLS